MNFQEFEDYLLQRIQLWDEQIAYQTNIKKHADEYVLGYAKGEKTAYLIILDLIRKEVTRIE